MFERKPYIGNLADARRLGYKTYLNTDQMQIQPVDYGVTLDEIIAANPNYDGSYEQFNLGRAMAQMNKYKITQEYALDKSTVSKLLYAYIPKRGYNPFHVIDNYLIDRKWANPETGEELFGAHDPSKQRISEAMYVGSLGLRGDLSSWENKDMYRHDMRNLYAGYPIQYDC